MCRVPSSISFPQFGHFTRIHIPSENKNALPLFQETKRLQTLCGTTLAAAPLRETAPHSPLPRADAVTGINRPRLLASSFSRRLQGDFRRSSRPPCTKRRLSLQEGCRLLVLFHAGMFHLPDYRITFSPFVKAVFAKDTRVWVVILHAKGNEFPRTGITNLPHLFFYTTNHDKPQ